MGGSFCRPFSAWFVPDQVFAIKAINFASWKGCTPMMHLERDRLCLLLFKKRRFITP
jgi:hypothetical protein